MDKIETVDTSNLLNIEELSDDHPNYDLTFKIIVVGNPGNKFLFQRRV